MTGKGIFMPHAMPIVFVVDDDPSVREVLESLSIQSLTPS
jgi:FixJ family two-component response regulator